MSEPTPQNASGQDLDWVAFCYVADELSEADRSAFESRLENDLAACEAVARAVRLADTTLLALTDLSARTTEDRTARQRRRDVSRRARSIGVAGLIASVLIVVLSTWQHQPDPVAMNETVQDADAIVGLWFSSQSVVNELPAPEEDIVSFPRQTDVSSPNVASPIVAAAAESSVDVPDWLMVALQAESASAATWEN
jgi:anti-sigma factor RsiW